MNGRPWTPEEDAIVLALYPNTNASAIARQLGRAPTSIYGRANKLGVKKSPEFFESDASGRMRKGKAFQGVASRFTAGFTPWNKGVKGLQLAPATQFKPGQRPAGWKPIGATRLSGGYLQRKVTDTGYPPRDWQPVHRLVWEAAHGPIPEGHSVAFLPGRYTTEEAQITADGLECVSRAEMMRRNSYHQYGKEIAHLVQLRGAITRQINKRSKQA